MAYYCLTKQINHYPGLPCRMRIVESVMIPQSALHSTVQFYWPSLLDATSLAFLARVFPMTASTTSPLAFLTMDRSASPFFRMNCVSDVGTNSILARIGMVTIRLLPSRETLAKTPCITSYLPVYESRIFGSTCAIG